MSKHLELPPPEKRQRLQHPGDAGDAYQGADEWHPDLIAAETLRMLARIDAKLELIAAEAEILRQKRESEAEHQAKLRAEWDAMTPGQRIAAAEAYNEWPVPQTVPQLALRLSLDAARGHLRLSDVA